MLSYLLYFVEMARGDHLGEFEHIVLLALLRLRDQAYGMRIRLEIQNRTGRPVSIGAVYATLERMESKGYVSSSFGDPTPERGGRAKRFFRIEARGASALNCTEEALSRMSKGIRLVRRTA